MQCEVGSPDLLFDCAWPLGSFSLKAGEKFLEAYAEPVVTNTYLIVALLILFVVSALLLLLLYRAQTAALRLKPLVISVKYSVARDARGN